MASSASAQPDQDDEMLTLDVARHTAFFLRHLRMLPRPYQSQDTQRMTLAYFALSSLDMLGVLAAKVTDEERAEYRDWIYAQQLNETQGGGFLPAGYSPSSPASSSKSLSNHASLAMTYTAVLNLAILRDGFERLDVAALRVHLRRCQNEEGSFSPNPSSPEADLRFVYCAFVLCSLLDAWEEVDEGKALNFVSRCRNYDGGYAQRPGLESHGGSTYCALASLHLWRAAKRSTDSLRTEDLENTRRWLAMRQVGMEDVGREEEIEALRRKRRGEAAHPPDDEDDDEEPYSQLGGLNGRTGKKADVCYSFWCGAGARLLPSSEPSRLSAPLHDTDADTAWLLSSQHSRFGGISKTPDVVPDVMHAYLGLAALGMDIWEDEEAQQGQLRAELRKRIAKLDPALNVSTESAAWLVEKVGGRAREGRD